MRKFLALSVLCLFTVLIGAQGQSTHSDAAMQCADTSKRDSGDVVVTNTCAFKIAVKASTPVGTQSLGNLDPGSPSRIATSAHNPWRVFSCAWPGTPMDPATGKDVTFYTKEYECDIAAASQQTQQSTSAPVSGDDIKAEQAKLYADARPYIDEPLPKLKKAVRELGGLKADSSQQALPDLLAKAGAKADELLRKIPNLISDERVNEAQWTEVQGATLGCTGEECSPFSPGRSARRDQRFSYIILAHSAQDSRLRLEEYRTDRNDKPIAQGTSAPHFQGFASAWVVFSSLNQVESGFRYLGEQKTDGHNTYVIGFAQIPGSVESPGQFLSPKGSIPMLLQGIAWIDQSDFRIVRLRTDLLAPQPKINFQKQMSSILFGPVRIAVLDSELWLPQSVDVEMEADGQYLQEQHQYSRYRLYQAKSKIILLPQ